MNKSDRPPALEGFTYKIETKDDRLYITINDHQGEPFEVFCTTAKCGSEMRAFSDAIGRLISLILQLDGEFTKTERLKLVRDQLRYIGGEKGKGFGPNRVRSVPDAVAKTIDDYLRERKEEEETIIKP
jgi:ribonucleoside-diphosphate reductase alpha chain